VVRVREREGIQVQGKETKEVAGGRL